MQEHGQELITDFMDEVKELLLEFFKFNSSCKPESIIVYRDGVSEGQFEAILTHEYQCIRRVSIMSHVVLPCWEQSWCGTVSLGTEALI